MSCCNCCPVKESDNDRSRSYDASSDRSVPALSSLLSPQGIRPHVAQVLAPRLVEINDTLESTEVGSRGSGIVGFPEDENHPSDPRSDCSAFTPKYRGGQNLTLAFLDKNTSHDPAASIGYTDNNAWYDWDGVTVKSMWLAEPATEAEKLAHRLDWYSFVFPNWDKGNFTIRGLKQLYDTHLPFANPSAPTVGEFERWNNIVLNHFRTLVGLQPAVPVQELFIKTQWSRERKQTTIWDSYGGTPDSAYGPCPVPGTNLHCGDTFVPGLISEQMPYWNDFNCAYPNGPSHPLLVDSVAAGTIGTHYNGTAMTSMSRLLRESFKNGNVTGHAAPWLFRRDYGYHIYGTLGGSIRSKWSGPIELPPAGYTF